MCVFVIEALFLFLLFCVNSVCCSVCADMKLHVLSSVCTQACRMLRQQSLNCKLLYLRIRRHLQVPAKAALAAGGAGLKLCFLQALRRTCASFTEDAVKIGDLEIWLERSSKDLTIFCRHGTNAHNMGYRAS